MMATVEEIRKITEDTDYDYFGLRADDFSYSVGDMAENSHQLFQDPDFDEDGELLYEKGEGIYSDFYDAGELDGTCTIEFDPENSDSIRNALDAVQRYYGDTIHVLAGNSMQYGNDCGEIIIRDAIVLGVYKK